MILAFKCSTDYSTKKEFKYLSRGKDEIRVIDSFFLLDTLRYLVDHNQSAYYPDKYDEEARISISRILYSPDCSKFLVLVVVETKRIKDKYSGEFDSNFPYHYYGTAFIGKKNMEGQIVSFDWFQLINVGSFKTMAYASITLDNYAFVGLGQMKNQEHENYYNVDDIRFWENYHWD